MRSGAWLCVIITSLLLLGCGGPKGGGAFGNGPPPVPITLLTLEKRSLSERISLLGESRSQADALIRSQAQGIVSQVLVDVGDPVEAGQAVAFLDGVEQRIALAEAEARLAEAQSRLQELLSGTRAEVLLQRESENRASLARQREAESQLKAVKALAPQLAKQVDGDYLAARAAEQSASDELRRTRQLVQDGALSARELVRVQAAWDQARGELIRAEQARSVQSTSNIRDEANALAALEMARAETARTGAVLSESKEGPRQEVISAQREVVSALHAARERAALDYQRTTITAQAKGTVRTRLVSVGDRLAMGDPVFELAGADVELYFEAPEKVQGRVEEGQIVLLETGLGSEPTQGKVLAVAQALNPESRRQSLRVGAPLSTILSGAAVQGTLLIPVQGEYLTTHRDALVHRNGRWFVYTVDAENKALEHEVDYKAAVGDLVAIASPQLKLGQEVVGRGAPGLYTGATVRPPQPETTATPSPDSRP